MRGTQNGGVIGMENDRIVVTFYDANGAGGLTSSMAPAGAREFARRLIAIADIVDPPPAAKEPPPPKRPIAPRPPVDSGE